MKIGPLLILVMIVNSHFYGQKLVFVDSISTTKSISEWTMDGQQNLLLVNQNNVQKKAIFGDRKFNQTFKSLGNIESILPVNALKILLFSAVQQSVVLLDNTLTQQGEEIDLSELGFSSVTIVCASNRPNLLWVYDQFRSSVHLIDYQRSTILQSIQNVEKKNDLIVDMKEYEDHLYVLFSNGTIQRYDYLLNFLHSYEKLPMKKLEFWNSYFVYWSEDTNSFIFHSMDPINENFELKNIKIPTNGTFHLQADLVGIQSEEKIYIYSIKY